MDQDKREEWEEWVKGRVDKVWDEVWEERMREVLKAKHTSLKGKSCKLTTCLSVSGVNVEDQYALTLALALDRAQGRDVSSMPTRSSVDGWIVDVLCDKDMDLTTPYPIVPTQCSTSMTPYDVNDSDALRRAMWFFLRTLVRTVKQTVDFTRDRMTSSSFHPEALYAAVCFTEDVLDASVETPSYVSFQYHRLRSAQRIIWQTAKQLLSKGAASSPLQDVKDYFAAAVLRDDSEWLASGPGSGWEMAKDSVLPKVKALSQRYGEWLRWVREDTSGLAEKEALDKVWEKDAEAWKKVPWKYATGGSGDVAHLLEAWEAVARSHEKFRSNAQLKSPFVQTVEQTAVWIRMVGEKVPAHTAVERRLLPPGPRKHAKRSSPLQRRDLVQETKDVRMEGSDQLHYAVWRDAARRALLATRRVPRTLLLCSAVRRSEDGKLRLGRALEAGAMPSVVVRELALGRMRSPPDSPPSPENAEEWAGHVRTICRTSQLMTNGSPHAPSLPEPLGSGSNSVVWEGVDQADGETGPWVVRVNKSANSGKHLVTPSWKDAQTEIALAVRLGRVKVGVEVHAAFAVPGTARDPSVASTLIVMRRMDTTLRALLAPATNAAPALVQKTLDGTFDLIVQLSNYCLTNCDIRADQIMHSFGGGDTRLIDFDGRFTRETSTPEIAFTVTALLMVAQFRAFPHYAEAFGQIVGEFVARLCRTVNQINATEVVSFATKDDIVTGQWLHYVVLFHFYGISVMQPDGRSTIGERDTDDDVTRWDKERRDVHRRVAAGLGAKQSVVASTTWDGDGALRALFHGLASSAS